MDVKALPFDTVDVFIPTFFGVDVRGVFTAGLRA